MTTIEILVIAAQIAVPSLLCFGVFQVWRNFKGKENEGFQAIEIEFVDNEKKKAPKQAEKRQTTPQQPVTEPKAGKPKKEKPCPKKMSPLELALSDTPMPDADVPASASTKESHGQILDNYIDDFFTPAVDMVPPKIEKKYRTAEQSDSDIIELNFGRHLDKFGPRPKR